MLPIGSSRMRVVLALAIVARPSEEVSDIWVEDAHSVRICERNEQLKRVRECRLVSSPPLIPDPQG
jgi:hypothetical protein